MRARPIAFDSALARTPNAAMRLPALLTILLLLPCALAWASEPIPPDKRLPASIIATLQPPATQPFHMPTDVAVDSKGRVYVADGAQNRIVRLSSDGRLDSIISEFDHLTLNRPAGICVDAADALWIADTGNHRIVSVRSDGTPLRTFSSPQPAAAHEFDPSDLAIQPDGRRLYVVDKNNHRLLILTFATGQWAAMGSMGSGHGHFQWPFMICTAPNRYVYITDVIGARVHRISGSDRWAGEVGAFGVELGKLYRPKGIAADAAGRLFVSDSTLNVVQVFSPDGNIEGVLCDAQGSPLHFEHPMGMCFDHDGRLYVVELMADRVAVVSISAGNKSNPAAAKAQR